MTQLEKILSHFKDLAYSFIDSHEAPDITKELESFLENIENGKITAQSLSLEQLEKEDYIISSPWTIEDANIQTSERGLCFYSHVTDEDKKKLIKESCDVNTSEINESIAQLVEENHLAVEPEEGMKGIYTGLSGDEHECIIVDVYEDCLEVSIGLGVFEAQFSEVKIIED